MLSRVLKFVRKYFVAAVLFFQPIWKAIGYLSNMDFAITASGNKRMVAIWTFITSPVGNLLEIVAGLVWIAYVQFHREDASVVLEQYDAPTSSSNQNIDDSPALSPAAQQEFNACRRQILSLSYYENWALRQLLAYGQVTGQQFEQRVKEFGFPILTLQQQREIQNVYAFIETKTGWLTADHSGDWWSIREEKREIIELVLRGVNMGLEL